MVAYSFQPQFIAPLNARSKVQTIRRPRRGPGGPLAGHARPDGPVTLLTGPRMRPTRLGTATALLVDQVSLSFEPGRHARVIDGHMGRDVATELHDLDRFAVMDGFPDWAAMARFWLATHQVVNFTGVRIYWGETFQPAPRTI